jgi:ABC-2 type transport system ATP-binding protein
LPLQSKSDFVPAIELKNLSKSFSSFRAIDAVSLNVGRGEVFGLLGPNGAGKTTTMRIISCLLAPSDGDVLVNGKSVRDSKNRVDISKEIGLLTESPNIYERLTAEQNLIFFARAYGVPEQEIQDRVTSLLEEFDLEYRRSERAVAFSKGMKQKLAIARALVHRPSILLLDEPTASLDAESAKTIRAQISETAKNGDHTVLLSTHNLDDASRLCDRIAFINHGRVLAIGSESEVSEKMKRERTGWEGGRVTIALIDSTEVSEERLAKLIVGAKFVNKNRDGRTIELCFEEKYSDEEIDNLTSKAVNTLVSTGAKITGVVQSKPTLEDLYLHIVAGEKKVT